MQNSKERIRKFCVSRRGVSFLLGEEHILAALKMNSQRAISHQSLNVMYRKQF